MPTAVALRKLVMRSRYSVLDVSSDAGCVYFGLRIVVVSHGMVRCNLAIMFKVKPFV